MGGRLLPFASGRSKFRKLREPSPGRGGKTGLADGSKMPQPAHVPQAPGGRDSEEEIDRSRTDRSPPTLEPSLQEWHARDRARLGVEQGAPDQLDMVRGDDLMVVDPLQPR